ncbi:MAG TPA: deoxyguanosinetriphosphate triphosphohydrolase [Streptosporangiaceae bacterium]|nr:deoxyguanosinetriphosphate triphosphohydrolase [Streptosporangiaceae bacterium]
MLYGTYATERFVPEPAKAAPSSDRTPFQRDRARVLHSSALRRLAAKTQVVEVGQADFPRTRLTHSLECAQIGRELGGALGCDPDLVDAACLAHDLGHPPFGHNGEQALAAFAAPCGGFEGNAQSLRLLTRIEAKIPGAGLNLTRATLDATLKYPWLASEGRSKYGAYDDDAEIFAWIRDGAKPGRPCLEAQIMDWADDVAYSVHDLEDGLHSGLITLENLKDHQQKSTIAELTRTEYCPPGSVELGELMEVFDGLLKLECWPSSFDGAPQTAAAVKNLTSELIGRFCRAAQSATQQVSVVQAASSRCSHLADDLEVPRQQRLECALLKGVTAGYVMGRAGAAASQARERAVLTELAQALAATAPQSLDPMFRPAYEAASSEPARLRVIVDQVSSLTDTSALAWHARLT